MHIILNIKLFILTNKYINIEKYIIYLFNKS